MRKVTLVVIVLIVSLTAFDAAAGRHHRWDCGGSRHSFFEDDVEIDIDEGTIVITHEHSDECVEITEDYELYIDGKRIKLDRRQQELVETFHVEFTLIMDYAKQIGLEGAKIGAEGAKLGIKAVAAVLQMIFTEYDRDDLEWELENEAEEIEEKAEKLERRAEKIEDLVDDLEDTHDEMVEAIPALDRLDWF